MKRLAAAALLAVAGCAAAPDGASFDAARHIVPRGVVADGLRSRHGVVLYGSWDDIELGRLGAALALYPEKDLSGLEFYRLPRAEGERGARYESGKVAVFEVVEDVLVHEIAHGVHARAPGFEALRAQIEGALDFRAFHRTSMWADGSAGPRAGFVTPYAARNCDECVAESLTAAKLWAWRRRGPLGEVDWTDPRFDRLYDLLDRWGLIGEAEREAIRLLKRYGAAR